MSSRNRSLSRAISLASFITLPRSSEIGVTFSRLSAFSVLLIADEIEAKNSRSRHEPGRQHPARAGAGAGGGYEAAKCQGGIRPADPLLPALPAPMLSCLRSRGRSCPPLPRGGGGLPKTNAVAGKGEQITAHNASNLARPRSSAAQSGLLPQDQTQN